MRVLSDREMEAAITQNLSRDPRVDPREIQVRVEDGLVYVTGAVDSAAERKAVQEDIEAHISRERVVDMLTLRNYTERSDEELAASVINHLIRDASIDLGDIAVQASGGVVTLSGHVSSFAQKRAAEDVVWWTPGVIDVISRLRIEETGTPPDLE